jgi:hypothetical protein
MVMRPHRTSWGSLVFGLLFIGAGILLLTNGVDLVTRLDWVGPILLIAVAVCLIASAVGDRPRPASGTPIGAPPIPTPGPGGGAGGEGDPARPV